jgi:hypothetical protein
MKTYKQKAAYAVLSFALVGSFVQSTDHNPKLGNETYYGSGYVERSPEFGDVTLSFNVNCLKSAEEVRTALEKVSAPIWKTVTTKITDFTETDRHFWGDVKDVYSQEDSLLRQVPPHQDRAGKTIAGSLKRYSTCDTKVELPLNSPVGKVFGGTQTLSIRASDMDWLEGVVRSVQKLPQGVQKHEVKISVSGIKYDVTESTKRDMRVEVQKQARLAATGPGSKFERDKTTLKIASAHFLGQSLAAAPFSQVDFKTPVEKGKAPIVSVELPFAYTIYAEAGDRASNNPAKVGLTSSYRAVGKKVSKADFGEATVTVGATCIVSSDKAGDSIKTEAAAVQTALQAIQGKTATSETDRVTVGEPAVGQAYTFEPASWSDKLDENRQSYPVLSYFDKCTGKTIPAPAKGELTPYYAVSQSFTVRTTDFKVLITTIESLRAKYSVSNTSPTAVSVDVSDAAANVTDATKQKLLQEAREDAATCILDPKGSLAGDAQGNKFTCVYLKSLRIAPIRSLGGGAPMAKGHSPMPESAQMEAAPSGAPPAEPQLDVVIIPKAGDLRGKVGVAEYERHYAFQFQFETEDYVPLLKGRSTPLP